MKPLRSRYARSVPSRRRGRPIPLSVGTHWLDVWLPRTSHLSQFGLFAITIGSLYFTVLPLYQKALLEEAIARKEVELAASERSLQQSYARVRAFAVKEFIFSMGAKCSGLLISLPELRAPNEEPPLRLPKAEQILKIDAGACVTEEFKKAQSLKELRLADAQILTSQIEQISAGLKARQQAAWETYVSIPKRAKADPLILKPLGPFSEHMFALLSKSQPREWIEANRFSQAVEETQSAVARDYSANIREQIATLGSIEWSTPK